MGNDGNSLLFKEESYRIIGACMEVYNEKGSGFHEPIYHECMGIEFEIASIPAISKPRIEVGYKGRTLTQRFEPDYLCYGQIVVELKAVSALTEDFRIQVLNYLKATRLRLGILVNFCNPSRFEFMRLVARDAWVENQPLNLQSSPS